MCDEGNHQEPDDGCVPLRYSVYCRKRGEDVVASNQKAIFFLLAAYVIVT